LQLAKAQRLEREDRYSALGDSESAQVWIRLHKQTEIYKLPESK